ncbi:MAG TPA: cellobiose phosphorylase, partial [Acholeplasmataceae bacterium]|nr:cellobiose phosphorylase [Acholeplasmataceae bacterium]
MHAHIRYIEAMAKIGQANDAYEGLFTINPILIQETVNNAYYRQSNVYFSSSDAWFMDRYQAKKEFNRIKSGSIAVKGGWRLYSSGPGIYINQMISNVFGIRQYHQDLVLDPVIPK